MTFSHDQIQEHLLGFLEGELKGEARAAFDAHLSGCETCRDEVRGIAQARALAREVVRAPLGNPVSSEVRARVLAAAAAARGQGAGAPIAVASPEPESERPAWLARWRARWFDRRNLRWTFPTFATVAAMAAFLLVRETIFREANPPLSKAPTAEAPPAAPAVSPSPPPVPAGSGSMRTSPKGSISDVLGEPETKSDKSSRRHPHRADVVRPEPASAAKPRAVGPSKAELDELIKQPSQSSLERARRADQDDLPAPAPRQAPRKSAHEAPTEVLDDRAPPAPAASSSRAESGRNGVPAPAPRAVEERAFAAPPAASRRGGVGASPDEGNGFVAPPSAPPPAAKSVAAGPASDALSEPEPATVTKKAKAPAAGRSGAAAPAPAAALASADPAQRLVDQAEKLWVARRFNDAAEAYRELLRRFPNHAGVPTWRKRLATAQAAATEKGEGFAAPPPPR